VVELQYNLELLADAQGHAVGAEVAVYSGVVEFMQEEEWHAELTQLVGEICTQDGNMYQRKPDPSDEERHAAYEKIEQVYGRGRLAQFGSADHEVPQQKVLEVLKADRRVSRLLTARPGEPFNTITMREGIVARGSPQAAALASGAVDGQLKPKKLAWARDFREKINSYVYRMGDGSQPQSWPLIRKVVLRGPWPVLRSGACLVDLPGVKDSNAARANVAATYLRNCSCIWIVAPIKRAVDDGTAKELLGEQFKRRLLMDGQYGNVSFICTQTDDCEPTEIMRDHADVAARVPGRLEKMQALFDQLSAVQGSGDALDLEYDEKVEAVNVLAARADENEAVKNERKATVLELRDMELPPHCVKVQVDATPHGAAQPVQFHLWAEREDENALAAAITEFKEAKQRFKESDKAHLAAQEAFAEWERGDHARRDGEIEVQRTRLQKELKPICAIVRNEYAAVHSRGAARHAGLRAAGMLLRQVLYSPAAG
jgi:hypothetical protein